MLVRKAGLAAAHKIIVLLMHVESAQLLDRNGNSCLADVKS